MRKLFWIISLAVLLIGSAASAAAPTNFAGTWALDKSKTQNMPRQWQNLDSVTWIITQDDKQLSIEQKVTGGSDMAGGGPGGGRPGGGMGGPRTYKLDGSETMSETGGQMPGKSTQKATWSNDGKSLELSSKRTFSGPQGEATATTTEKLLLSGDGKILTVNRHSESPRGTQDSTLVFNKQ